MSTDKITQLIVQLNRETASGSLQWKSTKPPESLNQGTEDIVHHFFECTYKEKLMGIYERRYKNFFDEFSFYWCSETVLCLLDKRDSRKITWEYSERSPALADLLSVVKEQCSGINDLLAQLPE